MDFLQIFALIILITFFCYYGFILLKKFGIFPIRMTNYCNFCGKKVENPRVCEYCYKKFCWEHQHPFHHECKEWSAHFPLHENCSFPNCPNREYLPMKCNFCQKFFCKDHFLPFNHNCENIEEWKNHSAPSVVIEVKGDGKIKPRV
jgi:predicted nucleic acid binding AN1-type Zn finger protein